MISDVSSGIPTVRLCTCNRSPTDACMGTSLHGRVRIYAGLLLWTRLRTPYSITLLGRSRAPSVLPTSCCEQVSNAPVSWQIGDSAEMTSRLAALCFDANDPSGLARFWSGVLGWEPTADA